MQDSLGIIGGLGSEATILFYSYIIRNTKVEKDQDHINMIILNHATIPDRTKYILDNKKKNPIIPLLEDIKFLEKVGCKEIVITCNTSYAFYNGLIANTKIKINHLIEDCCSYLKACNIKKVYLLSTTGTLCSKLYQNYLDKYDINYRIPTKYIQNRVMEVIYDYIKCGKIVTKDMVLELIKEVDADEYIILGCTELSLLKDKLNLDDRFIDPLYIEAIKVINDFNKELIIKKD